MADASDEGRPSDLFINAPTPRLEEDVWPMHGEAVWDAADLAGQHRDSATGHGHVIMQMLRASGSQVIGQNHGLGKIDNLIGARFDPDDPVRHASAKARA